MNRTDFGLCMIITRPKLSYADVARSCVKCGVTYLQLREKDLSDREILAAAAEVLSVTRGTETKFVVNDRADLALLAGADMLHLGQGDVTLSDARRIVKDMPIGLSTHSLDQAREALAQSPNYIGFGPIYPTTTKAIADPTVGTELLGEVLKFADVPVIAIGGIFPENVETVTSAGARNICLVRHLMECDTREELERRILELQAALKNN
ncbi:MAG: thiamine phosphate synthase [Rikenellaceae bacterium]